jgi:hypothetical protein
MRHQPSTPQAEEINMKRSDILIQLHSIIQERLFGIGPWLADGQTADALSEMIRGMRLERPVAGARFRDTELGAELKITLLSVFMGLWDDGEIPFLLEKEGLI